ncbi:hypothetical protein [Natronococcus sp. JC468]|uniref:hypothetical protein n=1 Tax=Natronococcus sp. JC468 TaxID=1961921 RepID=UPI001FD75794|nr:hypothetical protein [Natronococcus sp. JC468]
MGRDAHIPVRSEVVHSVEQDIPDLEIAIDMSCEPLHSRILPRPVENEATKHEIAAVRGSWNPELKQIRITGVLASCDPVAIDRVDAPVTDHGVLTDQADIPRADAPEPAIHLVLARRDENQRVVAPGARERATDRLLTSRVGTVIFDEVRNAREAIGVGLGVECRSDLTLGVSRTPF